MRFLTQSFTIIVLLSAASVASAQIWTTYSKDEFLSYATSASVEGFEGLPPSGASSLIEIPASDLSGHFRVSTNRFMQIWDDPAHAVDGSQILFWHTSSGVDAATITFDDFDGSSSQIHAFGLQVIDWGSSGAVGELTFTNDAGDSFVVAVSPPSLPDYDTFFFGVISENPFTEVHLTSTTEGDWVFYDEAYYGVCDECVDCGPPPGGDALDSFGPGSLFPVIECPGYAAAVWADVDQDSVDDTQVVITTLTGQAYPDYDSYDPGIWYFFTFLEDDCGGTEADRGRLTIHFVDMLAPGFVWDDPASWTYKAIPSLSLTAYHDTCVSVISPPPLPYQSVHAYRGLFQDTPILGSETPAGGNWTQYDFSDGAGIMELYVTTDYCENLLDNLILAPHNTSCGSSVEVAIEEHTITFDTITGEGDTTIEESSLGAPLPPTFQQSCTPPQYFEISTTATYGGSIEICLAYDDAVCDEADLRLLHYESGFWIDVTDYVDAVNNVVCGTVTGLSPFALATPSEASFKRGDCNADQVRNIADGIYALSFLFSSGPGPVCADACDFNDDGTVDVADAIATFAALFFGGPFPPEPLSCGFDPTPDGLDCAASICPLP